MEKIAVRHNCGHVIVHSAHGDTMQIARFASQLLRQACRDCQYDRARSYADIWGLPAVSWGSDRQRSWAEVVRARILREIDECMPNPRPVEQEAIRQLAQCDRARYWISRRNVDPAALVEAWARSISRKSNFGVPQREGASMGGPGSNIRRDARFSSPIRWVRTLIAAVANGMGYR